MNHVVFVLVICAGFAFGQSVEVHTAPAAYMPNQVDSNSPAFWNDGQLVMFNSVGITLVSRGASQYQLDQTDWMENDPRGFVPAWIEAVWQDPGGTLFLWYHHEPGGLCPGSALTAPKIGAAVSFDHGASYMDLGIVLESGDPIDCNSRNGFFAGGHGDFSVIPDRENGYFYFLFTNYGGDVARQGVSIARMAIEDRWRPVGSVWKYSDGEWNEPGLGGSVTPVFATARAWELEDADSFWGPSVHWNRHLQSYVVLLNRACCATRWPQEGIYIAYNPDLAHPETWTKPQLLMRDIGFKPGYYPQVLGTGWDGTDTLADEVARLYIHGVSKWELVFSRALGPDSGLQSRKEAR
jgi:hypothetical protein